jgi:hypothetical protein
LTEIATRRGCGTFASCVGAPDLRACLSSCAKRPRRLGAELRLRSPYPIDLGHGVRGSVGRARCAPAGRISGTSEASCREFVRRGRRACRCPHRCYHGCGGPVGRRRGRRWGWWRGVCEWQQRWDCIGQGEALALPGLALPKGRHSEGVHGHGQHRRLCGERCAGGVGGRGRGGGGDTRSMPLDSRDALVVVPRVPDPSLLPPDGSCFLAWV